MYRNRSYSARSSSGGGKRLTLADYAFPALAISKKTEKAQAKWDDRRETLIPPFQANFDISKEPSKQSHFPVNFLSFPLTARSSALMRLNYNQNQWDWYRINKITLHYTPQVPVIQPGFVMMYYEPNLTNSPFALDTFKTGEDFIAFIHRQKYGRMWPVSQSYTMDVYPGGGWKRTAPTIGVDLAGLAPDPLCDYGAFYYGTTAGDLQLDFSGAVSLSDVTSIGIFSAVVDVQFKSQSFGKIASQYEMQLSNAEAFGLTIPQYAAGAIKYAPVTPMSTSKAK